MSRVGTDNRLDFALGQTVHAEGRPRHDLNPRAAEALAGIAGAHRINRGYIPDLSKPEGDSDFYFVQADDRKPPYRGSLNW
jgi:hypothetical protein